MMRFIRYLILAVLVAGLVVVCMANWQAISLTVLPSELATLAGWNYSTPELPLFLFILASVAVGMLIGYVMEWIRESKHRAEVSKRQRQVKSLHREVTQLRTEKNAGKDEVLAILDDAAARKAG